jgi:hypothetical protein
MPKTSNQPSCTRPYAQRILHPFHARARKDCGGLVTHQAPVGEVRLWSVSKVGVFLHPAVRPALCKVTCPLRSCISNP